MGSPSSHGGGHGHSQPPLDPRSQLFHHHNMSTTSIGSSVLLDHRDQQSMRPRRQSTQLGSASAFKQRSPLNSTFSGGGGGAGGSRTPRVERGRFLWNQDGNGDDDSDNENTPLMARSTRSLGSNETSISPVFSGKPKRSRPSTAESGSVGRRPALVLPPQQLGYGSVNFPPSMPGSPSLGPRGPLLGMGIGSQNEFANDHLGMPSRLHDNDTIITMEDGGNDHLYPDSHCQTPPHEMGPGHRKTTAEEDVCFPVDDGLTDDEVATIHGEVRTRPRRRTRAWPDLAVLEEWSRDEKEERSEGIRAKKTSEPVYVGGRLRAPQRSGWHREVDDEPYRFTYFNDEIPATIHSHTISELLQPGQTFKELFRPEPRRVGPRPTFWLDVMNPTDAEMKVFVKTFGIHPLTAEDILMQETREKVELFRSYYLVSYRTFEQDSNSEDYLEPVNLYFVVFREGVISFHFSLTPHPANVRRRIRQLKDYITVSADWISYALIDDITDAFAPLIQNLEEEVDDIDDAILLMHLAEAGADKKSSAGTQGGSGGAEDETEQKSDGDMLKRVGDSRKKVMGLYRLLQNKADVIKGFAKRCNEQWEVAPRSEIGLYLGDIQDHIVTMVGNLNHMEKILSRSHSNYLAQINIKMNERQEQTADVLGRLTVLGTIVLPMNIITGLWGMNVMVPGQEIENLNWFWCITVGLLGFGFLCYFIAKRVYNIM
ncbi:cora-domain-containing protein [Morchella conica CCBAS932]|uniref:Cora-domain-containing protein n=1 Tax=Morchella conica CCBAS932 TaxID=1392247 RepID=A0A3N4KH72_9PEZI|nr:cora-domain-containing protein [Morchella conica CCBAS932]